MTLPVARLALLVLAALIAGAVDAIAGGGGLICLPALLAMGLPPHAALGTNKGQAFWGVAAALATYGRHGQVDRRQAVWSFPLGLAGSFAGAAAALSVPAAVLRPVVLCLLVGAAGFLLLRQPRAEPGGATHERRRRVAALLSLVIGGYDGFFGPGTGTFLIVGFVLCGASLPEATADAKVVNFASNLAAVIVFGLRRQILLGLALPMGAAQIVGGVLGARLAIRRGDRLIRLVTVAMALAVCGKLLWDLVRAG